jgi:predicted component of type VI protein secretion system
MAVMVAEVYDALREAGVSEDAARKAAEAVAQSDSRFVTVEAQLARIDERLGSLAERIVTKEAFASLEARLAWRVLLIAAVGGFVGGLVAVFARMVKFM